MPDDMNTGGTGPRDPGIEARVSALEARLDRLEAVIEELRKDVQALRLEFVEFRAEMRGRLTNIPTTFQIAFMLPPTTRSGR